MIMFSFSRYQDTPKDTILDMIVSKYQNIVFCCCFCCFELNRLRALTDEQPWAQEGYLGHMGPQKVRRDVSITDSIRIANWCDRVW